MRGKVLVVYTDEMSNEEFVQKNKSILDAAKANNIALEIKSNFEIYTYIDNNNVKCHDSLATFNYVLYFDNDINLARSLEMLGAKVVNSSKALELCENKANMYQALAKNNINIPKTVILPTTSKYNRTKMLNYVQNAIDDLGLPMIIKDWFGTSGQGVYLARNKDEIMKIIDSKQGQRLLLQEYIMESAGSDIRMFVIKNKVVASMRRQGTSGDFRSNLSLGGILHKYAPSYQDEQLAINASKAIGCDFAIVDILKSINGPVVCEVNTTANVNHFHETNDVNIPQLLFKSIK